jgi:hypothetical protein
MQRAVAMFALVFLSTSVLYFVFVANWGPFELPGDPKVGGNFATIAEQLFPLETMMRDGHRAIAQEALPTVLLIMSDPAYSHESPRQIVIRALAIVTRAGRKFWGKVAHTLAEEL